MKKILTIVIFSLIFSSCSGQNDKKCITDIEDKLAPKSNFTPKIGEVIDLKNTVNCIDWDSLLIQSIIIDKSDTEKNTGIKIPYSFNPNNLNYAESDAVIFFIKNKEAIANIIVRDSYRKSEPKGTYAFLYGLMKQNEQFSIVPKNKAVFEVYSKKVIDNQGHEWTLDNAVRIKE